ncbi:hypothetical protein L208DRAFT_1385901 [Tricholoma matsutake]|nr:hypothetical protein L208DRAFT_1385901 [Tricholoma matsutake 945]
MIQRRFIVTPTSLLPSGNQAGVWNTNLSPKISNVVSVGEPETLNQRARQTLIHYANLGDHVQPISRKNLGMSSIKASCIDQPCAIHHLNQMQGKLKPPNWL